MATPSCLHVQPSSEDKSSLFGCTIDFIIVASFVFGFHTGVVIAAAATAGF